MAKKEGVRKMFDNIAKDYDKLLYGDAYNYLLEFNISNSL